jgi:hypothetical protein
MYASQRLTNIMRTVILLINVSGSVSLTLAEDGRWKAGGDPHKVLGGADSGTFRFDPPDATRILAETDPDIFQLAGFRFSEAEVPDHGDALDKHGAVGSWNITHVL